MYVPRIHCWNKVVLKRPCCLTSWVYITSNILQRHVPGSPLYQLKFMYEVVAMVKLFGIPTWFMKLSSADLRWPELF